PQGSRPCAPGRRACPLVPAANLRDRSTPSVPLTVEPALDDVRLDGRWHQETDRPAGSDVGADGGRRDVEGRNALEGQHVPRRVRERLTDRIVPKRLPSRKWNLREREPIGAGWTGRDDDGADAEYLRVILPGMELLEGVEPEDEDQPSLPDLASEGAQRVDRVGWPRSLELACGGTESRHARDRELDHAEAVLS